MAILCWAAKNSLRGTITDKDWIMYSICVKLITKFDTIGNVSLEQPFLKLVFRFRKYLTDPDPRIRRSELWIWIRESINYVSGRVQILPAYRRNVEKIHRVCCEIGRKFFYILLFSIN